MFLSRLLLPDREQFAHEMKQEALTGQPRIDPLPWALDHLEMFHCPSLWQIFTRMCLEDQALGSSALPMGKWYHATASSWESLKGQNNIQKKQVFTYYVEMAQSISFRLAPISTIAEPISHTSYSLALLPGYPTCTHPSRIVIHIGLSLFELILSSACHHNLVPDYELYILLCDCFM